MRILTLACIAGFFCTAVATATPLTYDEAIDGELQGFLLSKLTLSEGINTIAGTYRIDGTIGGSVDYNRDQFALIVPEGAALVSSELEVTGFGFDGANEVDNPMSPSLRLWLDEAGVQDLQLDLDGTFGGLVPRAYVGSVFSLQDAPPAPQGEYSATVNHASYGGFPGEAIHTYFSYRWSFEVASVPEPGATLLAAMGALTLMAHRRHLGHA